MAAGILILYTRTSNPSFSLKLITKYVVQVYAPSWFNIRKNNNFVQGPALLYQKIQLIKSQSAEVQDMALKVVHRNGWLAEQGTFLCSMLSSTEDHVRLKAVQLILKAKRQPPKKPKLKILRGLRKLIVPEFNLNAEHWSDLIELNYSVPIYLPNIISKLTEQELEQIISEPSYFPKFPLHSTSVERAVKLVSESASKCFGYEARHNHILSKIRGRKVMPAFHTKNQFKVS